MSLFIRLSQLLLTLPISLLVSAQPAATVQFTDVTKAAGISFTHFNGNNGTSTILEQAGPGVCVFDYDGDGYQDIYFVNGRDLHQRGLQKRNALYRNNGDGSFTDVTEKAGAPGAGYGLGCVAGDYDNDGRADLYVTHYGKNVLYHNNGDGSFTKITTGSLVNDGGNSAGCAWADYDNDGFLDLFVANWQGSRPNFLYRNNGNTTHWLKVKCVGTASNRAGIGAKVRVRATIRTTDQWQLREISGGTGFGQTSLLAHFGLGDAAIADTVKIEWPSGAIQELRNVSVNRTLTVVEPPKLAALKFDALGFHSEVLGLPGSNYAIETSFDLSGWAWLTTVTNSSRSTTFSDPTPPDALRRFYRARSP
jgi:hypothetical protein